MTTKSNLTRRSVLRGATTLGRRGAGRHRFYSKSALASSGEINILMWSDYLPEKFISDFEGETGIKVKLHRHRLERGKSSTR